jgi:transmembrane sensor
MIEEVAADWLVERDRGISRERERELQRWLDADTRHAAAFNALAETWALLGESRPIPVSAGAANARDFVVRRKRRWMPLTLAAAAALAFGAIGEWRWLDYRPVKATASFALKSATEVGALRTVNLPDGSIIQLNTDTAVDVRYSSTERRVALSRGEAHFTVARNPERPFFVSVAGVDVRVVGTVFNVRLRPDAVDVLVTEGRVQVHSPIASGLPADEGARSDLTAGQRLSIGLPAPSQPPPAPTRAELSTMEIKQALAWQAHRLTFDAAPLADIVAEMNRYNRHKLVIADPALHAQRFGGSFPAGDCETIVRMLETNFGVLAERGENETKLRLKAH